MPIPAKQYDALYRGESHVAQQHPELLKGHSYVVYVSEQHGHLTVTPVSRVDIEHNQVAIQGKLGIPPNLYKQAEDLTKDWTLAEWPFDWLALRQTSGDTQSLLALDEARRLGLK